MKFRINLNLVLSALNMAFMINGIAQHTYGLALFNGLVGVVCAYGWWDARKEYLDAQESGSD